MDHFAGLDVSVKETGICIVDDTGRIMKEVKVASEPQTSRIERHLARFRQSARNQATPPSALSDEFC